MEDSYLSLSDIQRRRNHIASHKDYLRVEDSLKDYIEFFNDLEFLIGGRNLKPFVGRGKVHLFDTQLIQSAKYTLNSIKACLVYGSLSDANTLVRKFRDDIFFYLYFLEVDNNQVVLFDPTKTTEEIKNHNKQIDFIIKWFNNELRYFDFNKNIFSFLKTNPLVNEVINKHNLGSQWIAISKNLNNYVHNNGISYCTMNFMIFNNDEIKQALEDINIKINYLILVFIILLILIKPWYITSSDYIDYLDASLTPPEGSEYWVAPFIQEFIDSHINKHNPELKKFLKDHVYMDMN